MSKLRAIAVLPALFTLGNLVCGFFAIVVAARVEKPTESQEQQLPKSTAIAMGTPARIIEQFDVSDPVHNCMLSGWLIFLAMIFDALDGQVARLAKSSSDFGAQLDSLCDVVTFGVAPAFLMVKMCPRFTFLHSEAVWMMAAAYAACAALRLARFNAETHEDDDHLNFSGLPSPAAAAAIAGFGIMFYTLRRSGNTLPYADNIDTALQTALPFFTLVVAALMVSRIPYPHVTNQVLNGLHSFGHLVLLLFTLVVVMAIRSYSVPLICGAFVLSGPIKYAWQEFVQRRPHKEPMF